MDLPVNLQSGETVIRLVRRHPVYVILHTIATVLIALLVFWLAGTIRDFLGWNITSTILNIIRAVVVIVAIFYFLFIFYRYRNDIWLITNQRLIDSTKPNPFKHSVSSASLTNIQDVSINQSGFLATIFKFGNLICQTASSGGSFEFRGVPNPKELLDVVDDARAKAKAAQGTSSGL
ncbi:MAG: PH domain-containing protein [Anaerolineae bacterium]|nr:PH domain-containing protein [Anaerolineae bacterium]